MYVISIDGVLKLYVELTTIEERYHVSLIEGTSSVSIVYEVNTVVSNFVASADCKDMNVGRYVIIEHLTALESMYMSLINEMQKYKDMRTEIFDLSVREGFEDAIYGYNNVVEKCDYVAEIVKKYGIMNKEDE
ncbi:hypothetical protein [Bacteroides acidifaciens]|uniref:hypothetical protein n=1 Tax=Bacteroides acidifaciens TaxID=85831 RepID=UPI0026ECFB7B|nr:hypothetical protein [Bacteroides acidifaciens]